MPKLHRSTPLKNRKRTVSQREQPLSPARHGRDIAVIGTSAGGPAALQKLAAGFPPDFPGALFVTMHIYNRSTSAIVSIMNKAGNLPAQHPLHGTAISGGRIYVAPPDRHLILHRGSIKLGLGPKENLQRPSINAMFRSAAATYGPRVVGIVLTGMLDDGAAGLWEIQQRGGLTIVQDPNEADYPSMPTAARQGVDVDHTLKLADIPPLLTEVVKSTDYSMTSTNMPSRIPQFAANQSCPECGGAMTERTMGKLVEYRCHTGHRFGHESMVEAKLETQARCLWSAYAQGEEILDLLSREAETTIDEVNRQKQILEAMREILKLDRGA